ncbi:uncharacterized protein [Parasteatoda tepidariorum]|uniref:uncharacterized protein n=1 Tax=Parasteatoda tepidariorum TaxID=114398 RepID=UPI001C722A00|nr:uncharacterized protein LOC107443054 isoform X2 [Parasteatoda tepidariorum]
MTSKISGWFVLSAVFIVAVFGLFFTFTERKTWPEHRIELSATDQRLIPPASTVWCEAIALTSDHPFVAYQVSQSPHVNANHLNKQKVSVSLKLGGGRSRNSFKLKYFLLTSSVLEIYSCASQEGARLLVFKGEHGVQEYLQKLSEQQNSDDSSMEEASSEEIQISNLDCSKNEYFSACRNMKRQKDSSLVSDYAVAVSGEETMCDVVSQRPVKVNITADGFYVIVALNTNKEKTNHFGLQLLIDRSRYTIMKSGHSFDMCSLSTSCTIGLSFASDDGALVWIPEEPNAGRSSFTIRSRCKPRLAVFAILSVFLPLMFFVLVAFFVRADRERIRRIYSRQSSSTLPAVAAPLLTMPFRTSSTRTEPEATTTASEELPPPYHAVFDPPPPYSCLKPEDNK